MNTSAFAMKGRAGMRWAVMGRPAWDAAFVSKLLNCRRSRPEPVVIERRLSRPLAVCTLVALLAGGSTVAWAQDTAAEAAAKREAVLAQLPADAAKRVFGAATSPAPGPARAIGSYTKGCVAGAIALPADGPTWQVMRPSRDRAWGHPVLIAFLERLAAQAAATAGWPGLLVGDIAQPRGGPMLTGHESPQLGIGADIWLTPMPDHRLNTAERDEVPATN